jgi:hypothetical protein
MKLTLWLYKEGLLFKEEHISSLISLSTHTHLATDFLSNKESKGKLSSKEKKGFLSKIRQDRGF